MEFIRRIVVKFFNKLRSIRISRKFQKCGRKFRVGKNVTIINAKCISMGNNVVIGKDTYFLPLVEYAGIKYNPEIIIGDNVSVGIRNSFAAIDRIQIGNDVLFAGFVHITDHSHGYEEIHIPIRLQPLIHKGPVIIEDQCWLGFNCEILSGVRIGKHSIVAARSVVIKDVPPYSVVSGNPARVVKKYNFGTKKWEKVKQNNTF